MTENDQKRETCPCRVCRSDMAAIVPCEFEDAIEFEIIYSAEEIQQMEKEVLSG